MTVVILIHPEYTKPREQQLLLSLASYLNSQKDTEVIVGPETSSSYEKLKFVEYPECIRLASIPSIITIIPLTAPKDVILRVKNAVTWSSEDKSTDANIAQRINVLYNSIESSEKCSIEASSKIKTLRLSSEKPSSDLDYIFVDDQTPAKDLSLLLNISKELVYSSKNKKCFQLAQLHDCKIVGNFPVHELIFENQNMPINLKSELYEEAQKELHEIYSFLKNLPSPQLETKSIELHPVQNWIEEETFAIQQQTKMELEKKNIKMVMRVQNNILIRLAFFTFYYLITPLFPKSKT